MNIKTIEGIFSAKGLRIGIVMSRFNDFISNKLVEGAIDMFLRHEGDKDDIIVMKVPGAYEIPLACQKMIEKGQYDGIVAIGTVIRGSTPHFEYVANETVKGIAQVSLQKGIPISFGILTTDSIEQAIERAGTKSGNKGADAMVSTIEMINLFNQLT